MRILIWLLCSWLAVAPAFADSSFVAPTAVGTATTGQIPGTATNDSASAGNVGQIISASLAGGSAVNITPSGTTVNATSISLTAGDWDVGGVVCFHVAATTSITLLQGSISSTSATIDFTAGNFVQLAYAAMIPVNDICTAAPTIRFSLSGTTTVFLVTSGVFTVSTLGGYGGIRARRIR